MTSQLPCFVGGLSKKKQTLTTASYHFLFGPSYPPSLASCLSFAMWGTALLVEWLSPDHICTLCCRPWHGISYRCVLELCEKASWLSIIWSTEVDLDYWNRTTPGSWASHRMEVLQGWGASARQCKDRKNTKKYKKAFLTWELGSKHLLTGQNMQHAAHKQSWHQHKMLYFFQTWINWKTVLRKPIYWWDS